MSVSILGYKLKVSSLDEAYALLHPLREQAQKLVEEGAAKFLARTAQALVDIPFVYPERQLEESCRQPLSHARGEMTRRYKEMKQNGYRDSQVDFDFEIVIIPAGDAKLVIPFVEQEFLRDWFAALSFVESYFYYDHSDDFLDSHSQAEWDSRKMLWQMALGQRFERSPADAGMVINMVQNFRYIHIDDEAVLAATDPKEVRAPRHAQQLLVDAHVRKHCQPAASRKRPSDTSALVHAIFEAKEWLKTEEGEVAFAAKTKEVAAILPDLTADTLIWGWGSKPPAPVHRAQAQACAQGSNPASA